MTFRLEREDPCLTSGLGGIFVEVIRHLSVRIHPATDVAATAMIEGVKGYPLLAGTRGEKAVAIPRIEACLPRPSQLAGTSARRSRSST